MSRRRWLELLLVALGMFLVNASCRAETTFPSTYDEEIRIAVKEYWPDYPDWYDWKAQLYQESRLDPHARSSVGAQGLAQFMPGTWTDIERQLGYGMVSRDLAEPAIRAGAYYMWRLRHQWSAPRPPEDRQHLAQASYNAGTGNILAAQGRCGNASHWPEIAPCLPAVTGGQNARQTISYVRLIAEWRARLN